MKWMKCFGEPEIFPINNCLPFLHQVSCHFVSTSLTRHSSIGNNYGLSWVHAVIFSCQVLYMSKLICWTIFDFDGRPEACDSSWWLIKLKHFPRHWPLFGEFTVTGEFPSQRPVTRSFDVFFDLRLNKRLSKQSWVWWFETLSRPLWRPCNVIAVCNMVCKYILYNLHST